MPVFDQGDNSVNPDHYAEKMVGALCEVTFTLKHYAIAAQTKANGNVVDANDIFSAHVENVSILKKTPTLPPSPYKGRAGKKPKHRAQLPTRTEHINAAAAFIPHVDLDSKPATHGSEISPPSTFNKMFSTDPDASSVVTRSLSASISPSPLADALGACPPTPPLSTLPKTKGGAIAGKSSTSSSLTTDVRTQGTDYSIRPTIETNIDFLHPTVSISSAATLTSDDYDEVKDFVDIPSIKKQKTKE